MGAPAIPAWQYIDWYYKDLITKVKLNQMMEDTFYAYQRRVKDGFNKLGLKVRVDPVTPLSKVNILADALSINDIEITDINLTADITVSGVGGLDAGAEAISTWYSAWVIHNQTDSLTRALLSTSSTAPTMPTNYTKKRRVGWVRNDAGSDFLKFYNIGDFWLWDVQHSVLAAGTATVWTDIDCSSFVPATSTLLKRHASANVIIANPYTGYYYDKAKGSSVTLIKIGSTGSIAAGGPANFQPKIEGLLDTDSSQVIQYYKSGANVSDINVNILGYYDPV